MTGKPTQPHQVSKMFEGKAELTNPENDDLVATFHETCHHDGTAVAKVRLRTPILLQGKELLAIVGTATPTPMITVAASGAAGTEIREFQGKSAIGCIPDGGDLTLVKSPGGDLGTLLIVLGKGQVHQSNEIQASAFGPLSGPHSCLTTPINA